MKLTFGDGRVLAVVAGIVAIAAVATSIWLNPPSVNRARTLDGQRLRDLQQIETAISIYYNSHQALPADLKAIDNPWSADWGDPETRQSYEYEIQGPASYQLCAIFSRKSDEGMSTQDGPCWKHSAGRNCFKQSLHQGANK
jgi:hypothetical protein